MICMYVYIYIYTYVYLLIELISWVETKPTSKFTGSMTSAMIQRSSFPKAHPGSPEKKQYANDAYPLTIKRGNLTSHRVPSEFSHSNFHHPSITFWEAHITMENHHFL